MPVDIDDTPRYGDVWTGVPRTERDTIYSGCIVNASTVGRLIAAPFLLIFVGMLILLGVLHGLYDTFMGYPRYRFRRWNDPNKH